MSRLWFYWTQNLYEHFYIKNYNVKHALVFYLLIMQQVKTTKMSIYYYNYSAKAIFSSNGV